MIQVHLNLVVLKAVIFILHIFTTLISSFLDSELILLIFCSLFMRFSLSCHADSFIKSIFIINSPLESEICILAAGLKMPSFLLQLPNFNRKGVSHLSLSIFTICIKFHLCWYTTTALELV